MPESTETSAQPELGFGDYVVESMAKQLAQKATELAVTEAQLQRQEAEHRAMIDTLAKQIEDLKAQVDGKTTEFPAPEPASDPLQPLPVPVHEGRITKGVKKSA